MTNITTPTGKTYQLFEDMTQVPHMLIAGASGSGKSVALHGIITTLLYRFPCPQFENGAQLILIDPKRVELSDYRYLPHTVGYIGGFDPDGFARVLQNAVGIMDARYRLMESRHERTFSGGDLYVIIDEWANIIANDLRGHPCERAVQRLSCEGRAAKVHLILATQTPKAEILPTRIRCNLDWKLALRTDKASDSRIIMDRNGCEDLPTFGQGFWVRPGKIERYNIPYTTPDETARLVYWWQHNAIA